MSDRAEELAREILAYDENVGGTRGDVQAKEFVTAVAALLRPHLGERPVCKFCGEVHSGEPPKERG